jgi:hypothetical protein
MNDAILILQHAFRENEVATRDDKPFPLIVIGRYHDICDGRFVFHRQKDQFSQTRAAEQSIWTQSSLAGVQGPRRVDRALELLCHIIEVFLRVWIIRINM